MGKTQETEVRGHINVAAVEHGRGQMWPQAAVDMGTHGHANISTCVHGDIHLDTQI